MGLDKLWETIWINNTAVGQFIIVLILMLSGTAVISWFRHFLRYWSFEASDLRSVEWKIARHVDEQKAARAKDEKKAEAEDTPPEEGPSEVSRTEELIDIDELKRGLNPSSLICQRLEALDKMRTHRVRIDLDSLQQMSIASEEARRGLGWAGYCAGLALMLGLLGTFAGLSFVIGKINDAIPREAERRNIAAQPRSVEVMRTNEVMNSVKAISQVLPDMTTAFSASMVGIVCSIFCAFLNRMLKYRRAVFFERLERFTVADLLPNTVPILQDDKLLDEVAFQIRESFDRLEGAHEQNRKALEEMSGAENSFVVIMKEIRAITRNEARRDVDKVIEELAKANQSMFALAGSLSKVISNSDRNQREVIRKLETLVSEMRRPVAMASDKGDGIGNWPLYIIGIVIVLLFFIFLSRAGV